MADSSPLTLTRSDGVRPPLRTTTTPTYARGFSPHPEPDRLVRLTIDGKPVEAHAGELLIEVAGRTGIVILSFCYYPGLTLVAACRIVPRRDRTHAAPADCLHDRGDRWNGRSHAERRRTYRPVREDKYARQSRRFVTGDEFAVIETFRTALEAERNVVIVFGDCIRGDGVLRLLSFGDSLGIPVKYVCLVDDCNSRGAVDTGLIPGRGGLSIPAMLRPGAVNVLWIVGANPLDRCRFEKSDAFLVVQDLFLTRTTAEADLVLPAASAYEKSGTMTNVCGAVQRLRRALRRPGTKSDAEIVGLIACAMGVPFGPTDVDSLFEEIRSAIPGYAVPRAPIIAGGACATEPARDFGEFQWDSEQVQSRNDTQFTSGTLGQYCPTLSAVMEGPSGLYLWPEY